MASTRVGILVCATVLAGFGVALAPATGWNGTMLRWVFLARELASEEDSSECYVGAPPRRDDDDMFLAAEEREEEREEEEEEEASCGLFAHRRHIPAVCSYDDDFDMSSPLRLAGLLDSAGAADWLDLQRPVVQHVVLVI